MSADWSYLGLFSPRPRGWGQRATGPLRWRTAPSTTSQQTSTPSGSSCSGWQRGKRWRSTWVRDSHENSANKLDWDLWKVREKQQFKNLVVVAWKVIKRIAFYNRPIPFECGPQTAGVEKKYFKICTLTEINGRIHSFHFYLQLPKLLEEFLIKLNHVAWTICT